MGSGIATDRLPDRRTRGESSSPSPELTLPAAFEKLATATQSVITKRIDLVMLDNRQLVGTMVVKGGLVISSVLVGLTAWFAAVFALILLAMPAASTGLHLAVFASINAVASCIVAVVASRQSAPIAAVPDQSDVDAPALSPVASSEDASQVSHGR